MKKILLTVTTVLVLSSFSTQADFLGKGHNWNTGSVDVYKAAFSAAKAEQKLAKALGFEWRDVGKFLKGATKKYKAGDVEGALKLANKAKHQAILGQRQAAEQVNAGPKF